MSRYDFAVVGAGVLGLAVARELLLRRPAAKLVVLEQADEVGAHQTSHNSGVIHAGVYYAPGSLKAQLCVEGAARMYEYCETRGIETRRLGKLVIAVDERELPALEEIERRAHANRVPGVRRIDAGAIGEIEPHAAGLAALHSPNTGIVDFRLVCQRLGEDARSAGAELRLGWKVTDLREDSRAVRITGTREPGGAAARDSAEAIETSRAVFCAGLWADRLAVQAGAPADPRIVPFRGGYLRLRPERRSLVHGLIYPVPDPRLPFLGVHLTPRIDGEVLLGPSALLVGARDAYHVTRVRPRDLVETATWPGTWRMATRWWRTGVRELRLASSRRAFAAEASRYIPGLTPSDVAPAFAGVRAQAVGRDGSLVDDFVLASTARTLHVRNAPSPAATSALALAARIADALERVG
jgi:(S)-2-hydroxyglutarate dehydrogenase